MNLRTSIMRCYATRPWRASYDQVRHGHDRTPAMRYTLHVRPDGELYEMAVDSVRDIAESSAANSSKP
jgi:hypothetical protein